jgi:hypothetical protein
MSQPEGGGEKSTQNPTTPLHAISFWASLVTALVTPLVSEQCKVTGVKSPTLVSENAKPSPAVVPTTEGPAAQLKTRMPGLQEVMVSLGLQSRANDVQLWCAGEGAAYLEEVAENAEELCDNLSLTAIERLRFLAWASRKRGERKAHFANPERVEIQYTYVENEHENFQLVILPGRDELIYEVDEEDDEDVEIDQNVLLPRRRPRLSRALTTHTSPTRVRWRTPATSSFDGGQPHIEQDRSGPQPTESAPGQMQQAQQTSSDRQTIAGGEMQQVRFDAHPRQAEQNTSLPQSVSLTSWSVVDVYPYADQATSELQTVLSSSCTVVEVQPHAVQDGEGMGDQDEQISGDRDCGNLQACLGRSDGGESGSSSSCAGHRRW